MADPPLDVRVKSFPTRELLHSGGSTVDWVVRRTLGTVAVQPEGLVVLQQIGSMQGLPL